MSDETIPGPSKIPEPSMTIAAIGGLFLGILGFAVLNFFRDAGWAFVAVPLVTGVLAALLGSYVSAEPFEELKRVYDARIGHSGPENEGNSIKNEKIRGLRDRLATESVRFAKEASAKGADGKIIAEAAEIMRREAAILSDESN